MQITSKTEKSERTTFGFTQVGLMNKAHQHL